MARLIEFHTRFSCPEYEITGPVLLGWCGGWGRVFSHGRLLGSTVFLEEDGELMARRVQRLFCWRSGIYFCLALRVVLAERFNCLVQIATFWCFSTKSEGFHKLRLFFDWLKSKFASISKKFYGYLIYEILYFMFYIERSSEFKLVESGTR